MSEENEVHLPWEKYQDLTVHERRALARREVGKGPLGQDFAIHGGINAFGIHTISATLQPIMLEFGLDTKVDIDKWQKSPDGKKTIVEGTMELYSIDAPSDAIKYASIGEANDGSDKGMGKAVSSLRKNLFIQAFNLSLGQDIENEDIPTAHPGPMASGQPAGFGPTHAGAPPVPHGGQPIAPVAPPPPSAPAPHGAPVVGIAPQYAPAPTFQAQQVLPPVPHRPAPSVQPHQSPPAPQDPAHGADVQPGAHGGGGYPPAQHAGVQPPNFGPAPEGPGSAPSDQASAPGPNNNTYAIGWTAVDTRSAILGNDLFNRIEQWLGDLKPGDASSIDVFRTRNQEELEKFYVDDHASSNNGAMAFALKSILERSYEEAMSVA